MKNNLELNIDRPLHFVINGRRSLGKITLGTLRKKPQKGDLGECWGCLCSISHISPKPREVCGEDPLDALLNCARFLKGLIVGHKDLGYKVYWLSEGDDGGLDQILEVNGE